MAPGISATFIQNVVFFGGVCITSNRWQFLMGFCLPKRIALAYSATLVPRLLLNLAVGNTIAFFRHSLVTVTNYQQKDNNHAKSVKCKLFNCKQQETTVTAINQLSASLHLSDHRQNIVVFLDETS